MTTSLLLNLVALQAAPPAIDQFLQAVEPGSTGRRAVHIEVGANNGAFTSSSYKKLCRTRMSGITRPENERHLFIVVEPQPQFRAHLAAQAERLSGNSTACKVVFLEAAAWKSDGHISFVLSRDSRGAGVADGVRTLGKRVVPKTVTVASVDFAAFLHRTLRPSDLVFIKVDVETGEFVLLPYLLQRGALCDLDFALIEWHFSKITERLRLGALGLRLSLAQTLERGCPPRPPHAARANALPKPSGGSAPGAVRFIQHDEVQLSRHATISGLWERSRWHNGNPPMRNGTMAWSSPAVIMGQAQMDGGTDSLSGAAEA